MDAVITISIVTVILGVFAATGALSFIVVRGAVRKTVPIFDIHRANRPGYYYLGMGILLVPTLIGLACSALILLMILHVSGSFVAAIPSPPARGYAGLESPLGPDAADEFFPSSLSRITYRCPQYPHPQPIFDKGDALSKYLKSVGEPSLLHSDGGRTSAYRFLWSRSFDKDVIVRVEKASTGQMYVSAILFPQEDYDDKGVVEARMGRQLSDAERRRFQEAFAAAHHLKLPAVSCRQGYDGANWLFEADDHGEYRFVERWSPNGGAVRRLGLVMLDFTGWKLDPIY